MQKFSAKIYKIGVNPVVDPPDNLLNSIFEQVGRSKSPIPVRGLLNGAEFIQTLVKYQGLWRLYINGEMLKASGLKVGDTAHVEIEFDSRSREVPVPKRFADALKNDTQAKTAYEKLSPSRQKEILRYLGFLKTDESLVKNVKRVISHLRGNDAPTLHGLMRRDRPG